MKIEKIIDDNGNVTILVDGKSINAETTRKLTGCSCGNLFIYHHEENFTWGAFSTIITFNKHFHFTNPIEKIAKEIESRINKVREWVNSCKATAGEVEILDLVEIAADLHNAGRLYYRAANGTIKKLE